MEKQIKIKVSSKYYLYGKLSGSFTQPLFIVVHGLPGNMDEGLYRKATEFFQKSGFATFRFNLYGWQKDARQLIDSTLKTHAHDLDTVVRYFRKKGVRKIFVAGHSFGGPTILSSRDKDFDAVTLWDPSYDISFIKKRYGLAGGKYIKEIDGYLMRWGSNVVIGRAMAEEVDAIPWNELTKRFPVPFKIVLAGKGVLVRTAKNYLKGTTTKRDLVIIRGATHYFDDKKGMQERVYTISRSWFRRFM